MEWVFDESIRKVDNRIQWEYGSLALPLKLSRFSIGSRLAHIRVRFFHDPVNEIDKSPNVLKQVVREWGTFNLSLSGFTTKRATQQPCSIAK